VLKLSDLLTNLEAAEASMTRETVLLFSNPLAANATLSNTQLSMISGPARGRQWRRDARWVGPDGFSKRLISRTLWARSMVTLCRKDHQQQS